MVPYPLFVTLRICLSRGSHGFGRYIIGRQKLLLLPPNFILQKSNYPSTYLQKYLLGFNHLFCFLRPLRNDKNMLTYLSSFILRTGTLVTGTGVLFFFLLSHLIFLAYPQNKTFFCHFDYRS